MVDPRVHLTKTTTSTSVSMEEASAGLLFSTVLLLLTGPQHFSFMTTQNLSVYQAECIMSRSAKEWLNSSRRSNISWKCRIYMHNKKRSNIAYVTLSKNYFSLGVRTFFNSVSCCVR